MEIVDGNSNEESSALPTLIEDVLPNIFKFLPPPDKKNAKSVCKLWLQVLSQTYFTRKEAFFFPHLYDHQLVIKVVDECCRDEPLNLKFEQRHFFKKSQTIWRKCGSKIGSLHFNRCSFYPDMLLNIFTYCDNLKHLRIEKCEILSRPEILFLQRLGFPKENQKLIHKNLSFLDVYGGESLQLSDLLFIASAFPQLESLKIFLNCCSSAETNPFSAAVELLRTRFNQLTSLCVKFEFGDGNPDSPFHSYFPTDFSILSRSNFNRLKNISFSVEAFWGILSMEKIELIFQHKYWSAIMISTETVLNSGSVVCLLEENPLLEKLDIDFVADDVSEFCVIFSALVQSSLKDLRFRMMGDAFKGCTTDHIHKKFDSVLQNLAKNYTVLHLHMRFYDDTQGLRPLFLKYFPNVRYLSTDSMMAVDTISQQRQRSYEIRRLNTAIGPLRFVMQELSMENLEFLKIKGSAMPIEQLLNFHLPNLIYLTCEDSPIYRRNRSKYKSSRRFSYGNPAKNTRSFRDLPKLFSQKFPNLRGIEIRWSDWYGLPNLEELIVIFRSFQNFHQLHYISLEILPVNLELEVHWDKLIAICQEHYPSLQTLRITNGKFRYRYFYDVLEKKFRPFEHCYNRSATLRAGYFSSDRVNFKSSWLNKR